jgi:DNA-binding LacI/PurR family transcriptional regulator
MKTDTIIVNNVLGAREAIQFLINQGHKRIGILLYPIENRSPRIDRLEGYKRALLENGINIDESMIKICQPDKGSGIIATQELISSVNRPTAIFSTNTFLNLEVLVGVKKAGMKVPRDISLVGYDDYEWVPLLDPPLTTVAQPAFEMGAKAAALLINKIQRKRQARPQIIQLEPKLIIRESSSSPIQTFKER